MPTGNVTGKLLNMIVPITAPIKYTTGGNNITNAAHKKSNNGLFMIAYLKG